MSTATATAYRSNFTGRFMPSGSLKSSEIKPFHGRRDTYSRKAHCIKDRVLLDETCGFRVIIVIEANSYVNTRSSRLLPKFKTQKINSWCAA